MISFAGTRHEPIANDGREDAFGYQSRPHMGLSWSFARALAPSVAVWASVGLSLAFWLAVLVAVAR